jgi:hypothetical protein
MTWDPHREDEARWVEAMRQRHARGQEHVCGLADVLRTLEERDEARAEVERLKAHFILIAQACGNEDPDTAHHAVRARVAERDAAVAKAAAYERDWYDAKSEFGTATAKLRERVRVVERERDEWKARATFAEKELSDAFGLPPTIGPSGGEAKRVVDRLRAERRQLRRRLVECRPWVGVCPLEPAKINEVCLVRDLADDTLEEVKE